MTVNELINYLLHYADKGNHGSVVVVANKSWNPITEADNIADVVFIETKSGDVRIVLQTATEV